MKGVLLLALTLGVAGQDQSSRPQDLLQSDRPLRANEIATLMGAVRAAIAGKTVRLAYAPDGPGPDILFGPDGRRRIVRTVEGITGGLVGGDGAHTNWTTRVETIADYTGLPARRCDGTAMAGDLVIEYRNENDTRWKARARASTDREIAAPILDMLADAGRLDSGELQTFAGRRARAITTAWTPPASTGPDAVIGDPAPNVATAPRRGVQTLWIDVESLRPLRWSVTLPGTPSYTMIFTYDMSPEPQIPSGVSRPDCVP
jgi:hypothetical protein